VPSTKKSLPATQRLAHETHRASRSLETIGSRSSTVRGIFGRPDRRFPAVSAYRSICTSTERAEGTVPPRITAGRRAIIMNPSRRWLHSSPRLRPGGQSDGLHVYASRAGGERPLPPRTGHRPADCSPGWHRPRCVWGETLRASASGAAETSGIPLTESAVASEREPCRVSVRSDVLHRARFPQVDQHRPRLWSVCPYTRTPGGTGDIPDA
jgi:hypothetical protein